MCVVYTADIVRVAMTDTLEGIYIDSFEQPMMSGFQNVLGPVDCSTILSSATITYLMGMRAHVMHT